MKFEELEEKVFEWAGNHDLLHEENANKQFLKFVEEVFEFKTEMDSQGSRWDNGDNYFDIIEDLMLEMGDVFVTLIILCKQLGIKPMECLELAYDKIKNRKGKTIDGCFIKAEDLHD